MRPFTRSVLALVIIAAVALVIGVVAFFVLSSSAPPTDGTPSLAATPRESGRDVAPMVRAYEDPRSAGPEPPSFEAPAAQHRTWFADGAWWAALPDFATGEIVVMRLDQEEQIWLDTGTTLDERPAAQVDAWADGDLLLVASAGAPETELLEPRVTRLRLDSTGQRYEIEPDFPILLDDERAEGMTLVVDGSGHAWAAWMVDGRVRLASSPDGFTWSDVEVPEASGRDVDVAVLTLVEEGRAALIWSATDADHLSLGSLGPGSDATPVEVIAVPGLSVGEDQLSTATTTDGTLLLAIGTDADLADDSRALDGDVFLASRSPEAEWTTYLVARITDRRTRPVVMIDEDRRLVMIATTSRRGESQIGVHVSSLDRLAFEPGGGMPALLGAEGAGRWGLSGPRSPVRLEEGPVLVAGGDEPRRLVHVVVGDPSVDFPPADRAVSEPSVESPSGVLLAQTFDRQAVGEAPSGWEVRLPDAGATAVTIASAAGDHVMSLVTTSGPNRPRACRRLPALPDGRLEVGFRLRFVDVGDKPGVVQVNGDSGTIGTLEFAADGALVAIDAAGEMTLDARYSGGAWYVLQVSVDPGSTQHRWTLTDLATASVQMDATRPSVTGGGASELCIRGPAMNEDEPDGLAPSAQIDELRVEAASGP